MPKVRVSSVWQHYDINQECENFAICRHCGNNISRGGTSSNLKGNNTTNLWTHLKYKHSDILLDHVPSRKNPFEIKGKNVRVTKVKNERESLRVANPKVPASLANEIGALPPKWEQYEQTEEISDDIKDIIYSEDPLCYSPIQEIEEETGEKITVVDNNKGPITLTPTLSTSIVAIPSCASTSKNMKGSLDVSIDRLTTITEQLSYVIQHSQDDQNKDDDYYFALSLVPIMRQLSLNRKLYVRSKIQEILFKESEISSPKHE